MAEDALFADLLFIIAQSSLFYYTFFPNLSVIPEVYPLNRGTFEILILGTFNFESLIAFNFFMETDFGTLYFIRLPQPGELSKGRLQFSVSRQLSFLSSCEF